MATLFELEDLLDTVRENAKMAQTSSRALRDATATLVGVNECLDSRALARLIRRFEKAAASTEALLPEFERVESEIARVDGSFQEAYEARRREPDPGGGKLLAREIAALDRKIRAIEVESSALEDFDALESKPLRRAVHLLEKESLQDIDFSEVERELDDLESLLDDRLSEIEGEG